MKIQEKDVKNKQFGLFTVLNCVGKKKNGPTFLKCKCRCGTIKTIKCSKILTGDTLSCGCLRKRTGIHNPLFKGYGNISAHFFGNIKRGAKRRGIYFNLSIKQAWQQFLKQKQKCIYTNEKLHFDTYNSLYDGNASLDRIDSTKGYNKNNIQWVTKQINLMKHELTHQEFINIIHKISYNYAS